MPPPNSLSAAALASDSVPDGVAAYEPDSSRDDSSEPVSSSSPEVASEPAASSPDDPLDAVALEAGGAMPVSRSASIRRPI